MENFYKKQILGSKSLKSSKMESFSVPKMLLFWKRENLRTKTAKTHNRTCIVNLYSFLFSTGG